MYSWGRNEHYNIIADGLVSHLSCILSLEVFFIFTPSPKRSLGALCLSGVPSALDGSIAKLGIIGLLPPATVIFLFLSQACSLYCLLSAGHCICVWRWDVSCQLRCAPLSWVLCEMFIKIAYYFGFPSVTQGSLFSCWRTRILAPWSLIPRDFGHIGSRRLGWKVLTGGWMPCLYHVTQRISLGNHRGECEHWLHLQVSTKWNEV